MNPASDCAAMIASEVPTAERHRQRGDQRQRRHDQESAAGAEEAGERADRQPERRQQRAGRGDAAGAAPRGAVRIMANAAVAITIAKPSISTTSRGTSSRARTRTSHGSIGTTQRRTR